MRKIYLPLLALLLVSLFACHKSEQVNLSSLTASQRKNLVPVAFAKELARRYKASMLEGATSNARAKSTSDSDLYSQNPIVGTWTLNDKNNLPAVYIFTYGENKGFSVISADLRYDPVCAFVPEGTYNLDDSASMPYALFGWFRETIDNIEAVRDSLVNNTEFAAYQWCRALDNTHLQSDLEQLGVSMTYEALDSQSNVYGYRWSGQYVPTTGGPTPWRGPTVPTTGGPGVPGGGGCGSNYTYTYTGAYMSTSWDQGQYYNDQCPSCTGGPGGHMYTGCVATAMAQVLKFMNKTCSNTGCPYSSMPNSLSGSSTSTQKYDVARLMYLCGNSVSMNWGCSESGAYFSNIGGGLSSSFCVYSTSTSYNQNDIVNNMNSRHNPVILGGCANREEHCFIFTWYTYDHCHAWVVDGYQGTKNNCNFALEKFRMNWGWGGRYNGWFSMLSSTDFDAIGHNYQYKNEMCYDLH